MTTARGIRNNNPGNIRKGDPWQGLAAPPDDGEFCRFVAPEWGIRALARLLITYQDKHGLRQIRQIISRWAPPSENRTADYCRAVERDSGFKPDEKLDMHRWDDLRPLVMAIIRHENGGQPYSDSLIDQGLILAGLKPTDVNGNPAAVVAVDTIRPVQSLTLRGVTAQAVGGLGAAVSLVLPWAATIGDSAQQAAAYLVPLRDYAPIIATLCTVMIVGGAVAAFVGRMRLPDIKT